jgi:hypothetical protein
VKRHVEKERLRFITLFREPADRFLRYDLRGIAIGGANGVAIPKEVDRVMVIGEGDVLRGKPVIESVIVRLRLRGFFETTVQMPFAGEAGFIARAAQQGGNGQFLAPQVHRRHLRNPVGDTSAGGNPPGQQAGSPRRTIRAGGVTVGEPHALPGELIEIWRAKDLVAKAM